MSRSTWPTHRNPSTRLFLPPGESPASPSDHLYTPANDGTGGPFTIGRVIHSDRDVGFTGWIGGVTVFNRAPSAEELARLATVRTAAPISLSSR